MSIPFSSRLVFLFSARYFLSLNCFLNGPAIFPVHSTCRRGTLDKTQTNQPTFDWRHGVLVFSHMSATK